MLLLLLLLPLPQFAAIAGGPVRAKGREDRGRIIVSAKLIIEWKIPPQSGKPAFQIQNTNSSHVSPSTFCYLPWEKRVVRQKFYFGD